MKEKITIAIDAMGGENSPYKNIEGLNIFLNKNKNNNDFFFQLYGDAQLIKKELEKKKINNKFIEVIHSFCCFR